MSDCYTEGMALAKSPNIDRLYLEMKYIEDTGNPRPWEKVISVVRKK